MSICTSRSYGAHNRFWFKSYKHLAALRPGLRSAGKTSVGQGLTHCPVFSGNWTAPSVESSGLDSASWCVQRCQKSQLF